MARRFAIVSQEEIVAINEAAFFNPSELVNTKTNILLRVGEERWIYISTTIHLPFGGWLYIIINICGQIENRPLQNTRSADRKRLTGGGSCIISPTVDWILLHHPMDFKVNFVLCLLFIDDFKHFFGNNILPTSSSTNQNVALMIDH